MGEFVPISVVVLTRNEADNIERCLQAVAWCDEIIIINDSTDNTLEIAKNVILRSHLKIVATSQRMDFSDLRNTGLKQAKHEWILYLDADEVVTDELAHEIKKAVQEGWVDGYFLKRSDYFLGSWLKYGETGELKLLKLGKKSKGKWKRAVHEVWEIPGNIGILKSPLLHYPHPTVAEFISRINRWTTLDAQVFFRDGQRSNVFKIIVFPLAKFINNYFFKLGFLDGMPGLILAMCMSFHSFLTRAKLYMLQTS